MTKKEAINLIDEAWKAIAYKLEFISWGQYGKEYFNLNLQEEKDHDRLRPKGISRGVSIVQAAKLFAVRRIVEYLRGEKPLTIKDYLYAQKSAFYAFSLVENYRQELSEALKEFNLDDILNLDYVVLNSERN